MVMIFNAGSGGIPAAGDGWTNTRERAEQDARDWLAFMQREGLRDVALLPGYVDQGDGRWAFTFEHAVTGVRVELETHGIDDLDAYQREHVFPPRQYWNGSSTPVGPRLEDFAADGFEPVRTWRRPPAARKRPSRHAHRDGSEHSHAGGAIPHEHVERDRP